MVTAIAYCLAEVFGEEWARLSTSDQALIIRDCTEEGGVADLRVYQRSIGRGNLLAYAKTQRVRFKERGR